MTDQAAVGLDGQLLDASKIEWCRDPDDAHPIRPIVEVQNGRGHIGIIAPIHCLRSRPHLHFQVSALVHNESTLEDDLQRRSQQRSLMNLEILLESIADRRRHPATIISVSETTQEMILTPTRTLRMTTLLPLPLTDLILTQAMKTLA
jgi:hypothetical protein